MPAVSLPGHVGEFRACRSWLVVARRLLEFAVLAQSCSKLSFSSRLSHSSRLSRSSPSFIAPHSAKMGKWGAAQYLRPASSVMSE